VRIYRVATMMISFGIMVSCDAGYKLRIINDIEYIDDAVWIEQQSGIEPKEWDKISLIFGHGMHNYSFCETYIESHLKRINGISLRCNPAQ
jgi:hypothetical protein